MPIDKKGGFHINPQVARMHDANPKPAFGHGDRREKPTPDPGTQEDHAEPAHAVEIHHPNHPETGDGENYHVRIQHADGSVEEQKHPDLASAHEHAKEAFHDQEQPEPDGDEGEAEEYAGADEY